METRRIACLQSFIYKCGPCRFRDEGDGRGGDESTARSTARTQTQPRSGEATCAGGWSRAADPVAPPDDPDRPLGSSIARR